MYRMRYKVLHVLKGKVLAVNECKQCGKCCALLAEVMWNDDIPDEMVEQLDDGWFYMQRKPDGFCVALVNNRCSIYDKRPSVCAEFEPGNFCLL